MARMIHSMIRVLDEARSIDFYRTAFGLETAARYEFGGFTLIYLSNPETAFELELTVNTGRTEPYDPGDGYGHLAVSVDNVEAERHRFEMEGLNPGEVKELSHDGGLTARFFFVSDPDGYKIEVLERGSRFL